MNLFISNSGHISPQKGSPTPAANLKVKAALEFDLLKNYLDDEETGKQGIDTSLSSGKRRHLDPWTRRRQPY